MNPWALFGGLLLAISLAAGGYYEGWEKRGDHEAAVALKVERAAATERAALIDQVHQVERKAAEDMAAIDQQHQEAIQNEKAAADRTITDLRNGTIRLRDRLAAHDIATVVLPGVAAGAGERDAPGQVGLQGTDVEFLVRDIASQADQVADQLRECQAVVRADRAVKVQ